MLVSLLPSFTLAADDGTVTIDFISETVSIINSKAPYTPPSGVDGDNFTTVDAESTTVSGKNSARRFRKSGGFNADIIYVSTAMNPWLNHNTPSEAQWTIEVDMETTEPGWYDIFFTSGSYACGAAYYIYADGQYAGYYDCYATVPDVNGSPVEDAPVKLNTLYLTPDENGKVKVMFALAKMSGSHARLILKELKFTPADEPDYEEAALSVTEPDTLIAGERVDFEAKIAMPDGSALRFNGYKDDRTTDNSYSISASVKEGESAALSGEVQDGIFKGTIEALKAGETTVTVTATIGKRTLSVPVTVNVVEPSAPVTVSIDMTKNSIKYTNRTAPSKDWITTGFDIVFDKTTTCANSQYTPHEVNGVGVATLATRTGQKSPNNVWPGSTDTISRNAMFTIKKRIFGAGYYAVYVQGAKWYANSDFAIYVNGQYAGDYNFYKEGAESAELGEKKRLNTLYIPLGDVEISFRSRTQMYDPPMFQPYLVELVPIEVQQAPTVEKIEYTLPKDIYAGESVDVKARILMSDGSCRSFGLTDKGEADTENCVSSVTSSDEDVATVSDVISAQAVTADEVSFKINAKSVGKATANVTVKIAGNDPYTEEIPFEVTEKPKLETVKISFDKNVIPATRTAKASLTLVREDGSAWPEADGYEVVYESLTPALADVDANGVVTGKEPGNAEIKATVTAFDGTVRSGSAGIVIEPKPILSSLELAIEKSGLIVGEEAELSVTAKMSDGVVADPTSYTYEFDSMNKEIATIDGNGKIKALSPGIATITVRTTGETGIPVLGTFKLTVHDGIPAYEIDFTKTVGREDREIPDISPGYTVLADKGTVRTFRKFTYADSGRVMLHVMTSSGKVWPEAAADKSTAFAFEIDIPFESDYAVLLKGGKWYAGATYSVFIDGVYMGDHDFYMDTDENSLTTGDFEPLNMIHLDEGPHTVMMYVRDYVYKNGNYALLDTLRFEPVAEISAGEIEAREQTSYAVGEIVSDAVGLKMSNDTYHHFGPKNDGSMPDADNKITVTSSNPEVVEVTEPRYVIGKSEKQEYTISAKNAGTATLTYSAVIEGEEVAKRTVDVSVSEQELVSTGARAEAEELCAGEATYLVAEPRLPDGRGLNEESVVTTYRSLDESIATVEGKLLTAHKAGVVTIEVSSVFNGKTTTGYLELEILEERIINISVTAGGSKYIRLTDKENDTVPMYVTATNNRGERYEITGADFEAKSLTEDIADVDEANNIIPKAEGEASFELTVSIKGSIRTERADLAVVKGKSAATYMTAAKAQNARENYKKYAWAKSGAEAYIKEADKYVSRLDELYDMIHSEGIPRSWSVGGEGDPDMYLCRYCGADLMNLHGQFPWVHNALSRPWQVQCPECKRLFPSNDFEKFYELGLNDYGEFDRMRALEAHREMFGDKSVTEPGAEHSAQWKKYYGYGVAGGYLTNNLYDTIPNTANGHRGLREGETVETWGVDDSMGYVPSKADGTPYKYESNGVVERHTYVAEYLHSGVWRWINDNDAAVTEAIDNCAYAYFYTGDKKYGRVAAILIDRLADFYHEYDISLYGNKVWNSDGSLNIGKTVGCIWETGNATIFARAYDMIFDMYDDEIVLGYIREKAGNIKMRHAKLTPSQIRTNVEDGLLRTILSGLRDCSVSGNFGYPQQTNAISAVVLDTYPETAEWLDYLMAPGWKRTPECPGGGMISQLVDDVDADGQGNEGSDYNVDWHTMLIRINEILADYGYEDANLYNNPKFVQMFYSNIPLVGAYTPQIGDTDSTLGVGQWVRQEMAIAGWKKLRDPIFAQLLYMLNGNTAEGLHYDDKHNNPESLEDEVREVIEQYGEFTPKSAVMTNFGFAALRSGADYTSNSTATTATDTRRDTWMYFGTNDGHAHRDTLNLGMTAFGLNFMPDLGYPETTGTQPNRLQWVSSTISHNTVMVNEIQQRLNAEARGNALHFDLGEKVQVMDVSASYVYPDTDEYRRSVITVEVDDENSYTVDFFRVLGGNDHLYSFHATSNNIREHTGLEFDTVYENGEYVTGAQVDENGEYKGSYAGIDVPYGKDPNSPESTTYETVYPRGYTWIKNVDRDNSPADKVELDFEITDFKKTSSNPKGLGLHMTVLNGSNMKDGVSSEISIADGFPPNKASNKQIDKLKYVLIKNSGENLDTTFTTVFEPYRNTRYIESVDEMVLSADKSATSGSAARALKIVHTSGRVDYVFYSTDNTVTYTVTDDGRDISFRGFVGVYTIQNGVNTYKYVCDGDIIGEPTNRKPGISGIVMGFTDTLSESNFISLAPLSSVSDEELENITGRFVFVDNGETGRSGAWEILGAEKKDGNIVLDVGRITTVRKYTKATDFSAGYDFIIEAGQKAYIPLSYSDDNAPEFVSVPSEISTSVGSSISVVVKADSRNPEETTTMVYSLEVSPRGATINASTGEITWKPTSSQVGNNHFAVTAVDDLGRESTVHFYITVYGSTTSGTSGGGGGGETATPTIPTTPDKDDEGTTTTSAPSTEGNDKTDENVRFIDLGNHAWAEDSINALADEGIIKGTSENTFSPAANITRADFAILLVRAFKLTSDNQDNFTDVADSDYFAKELAIARNTGIVNGIGDNKYAPRNTITRQDMMVIVYRAMQKLGVELEIADVEYADFADVADYAQDAVKALITAGLVNGKSGKIAPTDYTTRAEVAVLIKRILDYTK